MKKYSISDVINLVFTGLIPVLLFVFQLIDYISWKCGLESVFIRIVRELMVYNYLYITYIIANSYVLRYCKYHRLMMFSILAMRILSDFMEFIPYAVYGLCINSLFLLGIYGLSISTIKFINQIKKYERKIKSINSSRRMC